MKGVVVAVDVFAWAESKYRLSDFSSTVVKLADGSERIIPPKLNIVESVYELKMWVATNSKDADTIRSLAKNINFTKDSRSKEEVNIAVAIISNSAAPQDVLAGFLDNYLDILAADPLVYIDWDWEDNYIVDSILTTGIKDSEAILNYYEKFMDTHIMETAKVCLAKNLNCPATVLEVLAKDQRVKVCAAAASNVNISENLLIDLADSSDLDICWAVATNSSAPFAALFKLSKHSDSVVRWALANQVTTPATILFDLAKDSDFDVRNTAMANPNYTVERLVDEFCEF